MARKNLLKEFKKPKKIEFEHDELNQNYGKFIAFPFEPGFGTTVGNTLRRVLLSSIQGYAVSAVKITSYDADEVPHVVSSEFSSIPGICEDTLEVLNTIKQIRFKLPDEVDSQTFEFEFKGPGDVKSDDFAKGDQLGVFTKDLHVFTMMEGAHVTFELQVELGCGYVPAETNAEKIEVIDTIAMDSIFTPIKKVKYSIEPCRVGQRNDFDKLILEITTDGTISPEDALGEAAKIATDHFAVFINFEDAIGTSCEETYEISDRVRQILNTPIEELELSVRSVNCLKNAQIKNIGELTRKTEDELGRTRNFGKKSLAEIKEKLQEWGFSLGMTDYSHLDADLNLSKKE